MPRRLRGTDPVGVCPRTAAAVDAAARRGQTRPLRVRIRPLASVLAILTALVLAGEASAFDCPNTPVDERLQAADVAFVGTIVSQRPSREGAGQLDYRFRVEQPVKGTLGQRRGGAERAARRRRGHARAGRGRRRRARDDAGRRAGHDAPAVSATPPRCSPSADEPRGEWVKLAIGLAIAAAAVAYSVLRLRRRRLPGSPDRVGP